MTLTPVESSHIAAVGLVEPDGVLLVRYRDGSLYARPGWTAGSFADLLAAPSVGKRLAATIGGSIRILGKEDTVSSQSRANAQNPLQQRGETAPLNLIDEDADECCRQAFAAMGCAGAPLESPIWCAQCGTVFVAETFPDRTRYWRIRPQVAIVRPG
jgi:hypothetical protein